MSYVSKLDALNLGSPNFILLTLAFCLLPEVLPILGWGHFHDILKIQVEIG